MNIRQDSQAFQSLLISDSLDDNADEYPDGLLCVILNIGLRASVTPITGQTMSIQSTDHVRLGLMLLTTGQFCLNCTLQEHRSELEHGQPQIEPDIVLMFLVHHGGIAAHIMQLFLSDMLTQVNTLELRCSGIVVSGAVLALKTLSF